MSLVNTKKMLQDAYTKGYAVGAFNINNMEIVQGIIESAQKLRSPVILQASSGARKYAGSTYLRKLVEAAAESANIPVALHLDHGESFEICKSCIDDGFTSVMIDGSAFSFEKNVEITKKVVDYAHKFGVTVEGEIGKLLGIEDDIKYEGACDYTNPCEAKKFAEETGVDSLAIAIGTSHGAYKFKPGQKIALRFDILEEIGRILPNFPIVLHGASSVVPECVETINKYGGKLGSAMGIPEEMLKKAAKMAVCKINIDSDLRLVVTAAIRKNLALNPQNFDPRGYLKDAREAVLGIVKHKIENVLGSAEVA